MSKILIIDDDRQVCKMLAASFKREDHNVFYCLTLEEGMETLFSDEFDVLFLDVNLPDGNGLEAIHPVLDHPLPPEIIIMTGDGDPKGVELAMKSRAWDYIQKTGSNKEFKFSLSRALEYRHQKQSKSKVKPFDRDSIVGQSRQIKACLNKAQKVSNNDVSVLITGETGTGKELFAKAIHENSVRRKNEFIIVDCAALPENLVESVLFGHVRGAFTGADTDSVGLVQLADKGTLFLDEVGELPLNVQKKFLRVLQEKKFRPVGGKKEIASDFRLVAATLRDLNKMIKQGEFREDFYFRIASMKIEIPVLSQRKTDIPLLVKSYLEKKRKLSDSYQREISREFIGDLLSYNWPGNVRELINAIEHACSDAYEGSILFPKNLPEYIRTFNIKSKIASQTNAHPVDEVLSRHTPIETHSLKEFIEEMKYKYIKDLMAHARGDIKMACLLSGLSRGHLYSLLNKYHIQNF